MCVPTQSVRNENEICFRCHYRAWFLRFLWEPKPEYNPEYLITIPKNKKTGKPYEKDLPV